MAGSDVTERESYLCIKTRQNPTFHWGNLLFFRDAPTSDSLPIWVDHFRREFTDIPDVKHMTFAWDDPTGKAGALAPFLSAGFAEDRAVVLTASAVTAPPRLVRDLSWRPLKSDADWQELTELQFLTRDPKYEPERHRIFVERRYASYRKMVEAGFGHWYGVFVGGKLASTLGLFFEGPIGRFQNVGTHPEFQRQGLCGSLVYQVSRDAFASGKAASLVMLADPDYHAARIYESVGFRPTEHLSGVVKAGPGMIVEPAV